MADKIDELRKKIDGIDKKVLDLLRSRAGFVLNVARIKKASGGDFYVPHREKNIITRLVGGNRGPLSAESVESIFREIINACRSLESRIRIAYLGPQATFTHQAALKNFGSGAQYLPTKSIGDVFTEVERGRADYGFVPIENTTEGVINHTLDMFIESDLVICAEMNMPIEHCLLSKTGNKNAVKVIYSRPEVLAQCREWLEENMRNVPVREIFSTAEASKRAAGDSSIAAIASRIAAASYNLEIIAGGIQDNSENMTRFLAIGHKPAERSGHDKTSVMFSIKDRIGALHDMLVPFKRNGINLTKIESRPTKKKAWEYIFFIDCLGHISDRKVQKAIQELGRDCVFLKVLGSYPRAE